MIKKIFKIIEALLEIIIILILILYPLLVKGESPITFYWNHLKELWIIIKQPHLFSRLLGNFSLLFKVKI